MQWNTTTPLPQVFLHELRIRESSKVVREEEGLVTSLQTIHNWIGGGAKLNLSKSPDTDVLKTIVLKLQRRVETQSTTLLRPEVSTVTGMKVMGSGRLRYS